MLPSAENLLPILGPSGLFPLGSALVLTTSLHSVLLWQGQRREDGLGHVLLAAALLGFGLLARLGGAGPAALVNLALLGGAGYGLWALRHYAGLPARMNRWSWSALGCWLLAALALHAMGFEWVRPLVVPVTLVTLELGLSRELGRLTCEGASKAPAVAGALLVGAMALAELGFGVTAACFSAGRGGDPPQARAWLLFGILVAQQLATLLLAQVQGQRMRSRLERLVATDPITGLASGLGFRESLARVVGRSLRTGRTASVLVLDLDGYAALRTTFGPAAATRVLEAFARTLRQTLRESDLCSRLEGCRFAALLHQTQPMEALLAAERLRETWADLALSLGAQAFRPTFSGGVASTREAIGDGEDLLDLAIARVAAARAGGGNNVEGEPPTA